MDALNKKYNIKIEVLTPLSIGAGAEKDWVCGVDFVEKDEKVYRLNLHKIIQSDIDVSKLTSCIEKKDTKGLQLLIGNKLQLVSDSVLDSPLSSSVSSDIKAFIKNQLSNSPIIPGSSLKGSIRSILFHYLRDRERDDKEVFGNSTDGDEFMRYIKIADAEFSETQLVNTKIFNLQGRGNNWLGGWKHEQREGTSSNFKPIGFNTVYETLMPHEIGYSTIMFSKAFLSVDWTKFYLQLKKKAVKEKEISRIESLEKKVSQKKSIIEDVNSLKSLFFIVNAHTRAYLEKEKEFFQKYNQAEYTQEIINSINYLLAQIPSDNSCCILKMSAGSGFHFITGDWQFDDYSIDSITTKKNGSTDKSFGYDIDGRKSKSAKSRKIAVWDNHFDLMGFVKISALSEEESNALQDSRRQELAAREALQKELAEKERLEREEKERQEQEYQQNLKAYTEYCLQTKQAFENEKWEDVLSFAEKASSIFSDKAAELKELIEKAQSNIALAESQKSVEEAKQREEEERKLKNRVPLSEKIVNVNKLPTLFGNLKQWMKQNERQSLSEEELTVLHNKIVEIYASFKEKEKASWKTRPNQWKDLTALLGQEVVERWVQEL